MPSTFAADFPGLIRSHRSNVQPPRRSAIRNAQDYFFSPSPTPQQLDFWLAELRTPDLLLGLVSQFPDRARLSERPAVLASVDRDRDAIENALDDEQRAERMADRLYWAPLKEELEQLRMRRRHAQPYLDDPFP